MSRCVAALLCLFTSLLLSSCEHEESAVLSQSSEMTQGIINGEKCLPNQHESAVEIVVEAQIDFGILGLSYVSNSLCGATLIAPDVLLTAAHCLNTSDLTLGVGRILNLAYYVTWDSDLNYLEDATGPMVPKNSVRATAWMREPGFDPTKSMDGLANYHDVALVFLEKPLPFKPATLISKDEAHQIQKDKEVTIAGWGQRSPDSFKLIPSLTPRTSGEKYCATTVINEVGAYELQIGNEKMPRKCFGDSGGPTYMNVVTPFGVEQRLIGITSHAYNDEICLTGGIDTRVDAWLDWIDSTMRRGCETGIRVWCDVEGVIEPQYNWVLRLIKTLSGWIF